MHYNVRLSIVSLKLLPFLCYICR